MHRRASAHSAGICATQASIAWIGISNRSAARRWEGVQPRCWWGASNLRPAGSLYTAGRARSVKFGVSDSVGEPTTCQGESQRLIGSRTRPGESWALRFAAQRQTSEPGECGRGQLNEGPLLGNERENHNVAGLPS